jgi:DNA-binding beta-propeller fold protein YncE
VLVATTVLSSVVATTAVAPAAEPDGGLEPAGAGTFVPSPLVDPAQDVLRAEPSGSNSLRPMLLVGNNWDGTVDVIDPHTLEGVGQLNVAPDFEEVVAGMSPDQLTARQLNNEFAAEGHDQLVDDMRVSMDGKTLYASRPSLGDAIAMDLVTGEVIWRTPVKLYRSDHIALSPDGSEMLVSSTVAKVVEVLDTRTGAVIDEIPTGDFPHENEYSHDGELIFNGAIGRVITPDNQILDIAKGDRIFTIADADTHEVIKQITFDRGIRPYIVMGDNRTAYIQLSFFHGFIEYDLVTEQVLNTVHLPLSEEAENTPVEDYPLDSAHHGLAMNHDETKICDAGTVSDYVAIVDRSSLALNKIIPVGGKPYWAVSSADGELCFVANSDTDDVSVISYDQEAEIARLPVGDHPQRMRMLPMIVPDLEVSVKPRRVERGERERVKVNVTAAGTGILEGANGAGGPVAGATVKIGGKTATTNAEGVAKIRGRFRKKGKLKVAADASGYAGGDAKLRVRRSRPRPRP